MSFYSQIMSLYGQIMSFHSQNISCGIMPSYRMPSSHHKHFVWAVYAYVRVFDPIIQRGWTALHYGLDHNSKDTVGLLLKRNDIKVNITDKVQSHCI